MSEPAPKVLSADDIHDNVPEVLPSSDTLLPELELGREVFVETLKDTTFATGSAISVSTLSGAGMPRGEVFCEGAAHFEGKVCTRRTPGWIAMGVARSGVIDIGTLDSMAIAG